MGSQNYIGDPKRGVLVKLYKAGGKMGNKRMMLCPTCGVETERLYTHEFYMLDSKGNLRQDDHSPGIRGRTGGMNKWEILSKFPPEVRGKINAVYRCVGISPHYSAIISE